MRDIQKEIEEYVVEHHVTEFADMVSYAVRTENDDWINYMLIGEGHGKVWSFISDYTLECWKKEQKQKYK